MLVSGGEALVDLVPAQGSGVDLLAARLGGGPYNVALTVARLGAPTAFLSRLSTDRFGEALVERLEASNVDVSLVQRGPEPTTLAVVSPDADVEARYSFYTEGTADRLIVDPGPLPEGTRALSVGTLGMVLEPGAGVYEAVLHRAAARGILTALDPNIRPAMISEPEAYRARLRSWLPSVRLLKLSVDDAVWLAGAGSGAAAGATGTTGTTGTTRAVRTSRASSATGAAAIGASDMTGDSEAVEVAERAVRSWLDQGVRAVVLTHGGAGLSVRTAEGTAVSIPAVPARVVDTIGAGDTVQGALLAWLMRYEVSDPAALGSAEWSRALEYAARAAASTVSRSGADPPVAGDLAAPERRR